jgi:hypothetical protein
LGMYIDNGAIFMCGHNWEEIESTMRTGYTACIEWLTRAGVKAPRGLVHSVCGRGSAETTLWWLSRKVR